MTVSSTGLRGKRPSLRILARVKDGLQNGDVGGALEFLDGARAPAELDAFRDQKVLFSAKGQVARRALAERYATCAIRILPSDEHATAERYAQFALLAADQFDSLSRVATTERAILSRVGRSTMMQACADVANRYARTYLDAMWADYPLEAESRAQAAATASRLHRANAQAVDLAFAVTRAVTFIAPVTSGRRAERPQNLGKRERKAVESLIAIASQWNCFEHMLDQVTFGEWVVDDITFTPHEVRLAPATPTLYRAKQLAIRNRLVRHNFIRTRQSWIEREMNDVISGTVSWAAEYFRARPHANHLSTGDVEASVRKRLWLTALDVEDELLVAADVDRPLIAAHYAVALMLRCFQATGEVLNGSQKDVVRYTWFEREAVEYLLSNLSITPEMASTVIAAHVAPIPRRHFDLFQRPFVLVSGSVIGVLGFGGDWPSSLRLMADRHGPLSDRYGRLWERFVEQSLNGCGWRTLGCGIRLKDGGRDLTDIDLLMLKGETVYVLQVKGISNSGLNPFEQWKARAMVEEGVAQAAKAVAWLERNATILPALKGVAYACVQPVVVTNVELFNGWQLDGVPIVHLSEVKSWYGGASVRIKNGKGDTIEVHRFIAGSEPTDAEIRALLAEPLTWRTEEQPEPAAPIVERVRSVTFHIPR